MSLVRFSDSRRTAGVIFVCFLFIVLFSEGIAASLAEHDCDGDGCPVCAQIEIAASFSRQLRSASAGNSFFLSSILFCVPLAVIRNFCLAAITSVRLKVRMNR